MAQLTPAVFNTRIKGYDKEQIDRLVDRVQRTLSGTAGKDRIRVVELQYFYFDVRVGGYDRSEVHEFMQQAIGALRQRAVAA